MGMCMHIATYKRRPTMSQLFHEGETRVQERYGVRSFVAGWAGKAVRSYLPEQHRLFYSQLPFVVLAGRRAHADGERVWCSLLTRTSSSGIGASVNVLDEHTIEFAGTNSVRGSALYNTDPMLPYVVTGRPLGVLGIMLHNHRRNRVNGTAVRAADGAMQLKVGQTFGNCPQYIVTRAFRSLPPLRSRAALLPPPLRSRSVPENEVQSGGLSHPLISLIRSSDTMFIASGIGGSIKADATRGMDASHRGGPRGFVSCSSDGKTLSFIDLPGNNMFSTIGNLVIDPRVGLAFVHWRSGSLLQLSGTAAITFLDNSPSRLVEVSVERFVWRPFALGMSFLVPEELLRRVRVSKVQDEADGVKSIFLQSADDKPLESFAAGQYITVRVGAGSRQAVRTYSISTDPSESRSTGTRPGAYRITVLKKGAVSRYLHALQPGSQLEIERPNGEFTIDWEEVKHSSGVVVMLAGGIGVTPLVSMVHEVAACPKRPRILFIHSIRSRQDAVLHDELLALQRRGILHLHVTYTREDSVVYEGSARLGTSHSSHSFGRLSQGVLDEQLRLMGAASSHAAVPVYVCGPQPFMASAQNLCENSIVASRVVLHGESFGPSSFQ